MLPKMIASGLRMIQRKNSPMIPQTKAGYSKSIALLRLHITAVTRRCRSVSTLVRLLIVGLLVRRIRIAHIALRDGSFAPSNAGVTADDRTRNGYRADSKRTMVRRGPCEAMWISVGEPIEFAISFGEPLTGRCRSDPVEKGHDYGTSRRAL